MVRWRKKHSNYTDVAGADITIHSPAFTDVTALLKHVTEFSQSRLNWDTRMNATTFKPATVREKTLSDPTKSCCVATVQGQRRDSRSWFCAWIAVCVVVLAGWETAKASCMVCTTWQNMKPQLTTCRRTWHTYTQPRLNGRLETQCFKKHNWNTQRQTSGAKILLL